MVVDDHELRHGRANLLRPAARAQCAVTARAAPRRSPQRAARLGNRTPVVRPRSIVTAHGEGHREAHPPALADLVPDGRAPAGHRAGDPPRRRGLQRDERGRLRAALLRRPRRARVAGHPAHRRQARSTASPSRRTTRCARRTSTCPPIAFTDEELASLQIALTLLDGEFAYAEPLRLALQQISWGRPEPAAARPTSARSRSASPASAGGHELSQRLAKIETAIFRNKTITFDYYTMERDEVGAAQGRPVPPALPGRPVLPPRPLPRARARCASSASRASAARSPTRRRPSTTSSARRDFDPRAYANRADWQFGDDVGTAEIWVSERIAWQVERHFGRFGEVRPADDGGDRLRAPTYANARQLVAWVLRLGEHARVARPARAGRRGRRARRAARRAPRRRPRRSPRAVPAAPRRGADERRRTPTATAAPRRPRSAPSASRASSRSRRSSSTPAARGQRLRVDGRLRAPADLRRGAARGRQRPQRRQLRRRLLRPLRRGRATTARSRSTPSPTPTTSPAPRGCCPSRPRRSSRRSTSSASTCPRAR